jgi:hypothetical protein
MIMKITNQIKKFLTLSLIIATAVSMTAETSSAVGPDDGNDVEQVHPGENARVANLNDLDLDVPQAEELPNDPDADCYLVVINVPDSPGTGGWFELTAVVPGRSSLSAEINDTEEHVWWPLVQSPPWSGSYGVLPTKWCSMTGPGGRQRYSKRVLVIGEAEKPLLVILTLPKNDPPNADRKILYYIRVGTADIPADIATTGDADVDPTFGWIDGPSTEKHTKKTLFCPQAAQPGVVASRSAESSEAVR